MKLTLHQNYDDARKYLVGLSVEAEFFNPVGIFDKKILLQPSPVVIQASLLDGGARAVIIFYRFSREIGLWVNPRLRNRGIGAQMMNSALSDKHMQIDVGPIYARTSTCTTPSTIAMRRILRSSNFQKITSGEGLDLWVLYRDQALVNCESSTYESSPIDEEAVIDLELK